MFSAKSRITIGLACLLVTVLCTAVLIGLVPENRTAVLAGRAVLCETIAVCASDYVSRGEPQRLERFLDLVVKRNPEIASAGIRQADGRLLAQVGKHADAWSAASKERSTETHVQVPIRSGKAKWGSVELRFLPVTTSGWRGWFQQPWVRLTLFVTAFSSLCFVFYLRKMLDHLDPSRAVPKRVRAALDTLAEGLLVIDNNERIVLANQALSNWVNRDPDKLIGVKASTLPWLMSSAASLEEYPWIAAMRLERPQANVMLGLAHHDQPPRMLLANASPVLGHDGHYRGVLVSFGDVTQLEETKKDLSLAKRAAEEANQAKSEFLARMSHEIRTPMNAILGYTDVLRRGFDESAADRQQYLDTIHASGEHLLTLINDILDLSKIEAGRMQLEPGQHSPHRIAADCISVLRMKAEQKGIRLDLEFPRPLPATVRTDVVRLRQALINLIGNAIKFTDRGGVRVVARMTGDRLAFEITDTGIGISPEGLHSIFEPFAQADTSITRRFGGTGLGLTISRQLARAMGGDITVASTPGQGSTFVLTIDPGSLEGIPLVDADQSQTSETQPIQSLEIRPLRSARILVADDGESNRKLVQLVLGRAGLEVVAVENGQQAVERVLTGHFDVVLMDMQMPVLDGYAATRQLRQSGYQRPILALTAHAMQGDEEKCRAAGCSGFLTKPISIDRLLTALAELVGVAETPEAAPHTPAPTKPHTAAWTAAKKADAPLRSTLPADDADFREIVEEFVARLQEKLSQMQEACAAEKYDQLGALAHWLRGCGGSAGFDAFTKPARALEQLARQGNSELAPLVIDDLFRLAQRIELPWRTLGTAAAPQTATEK